MNVKHDISLTSIMVGNVAFLPLSLLSIIFSMHFSTCFFAHNDHVFPLPVHVQGSSLSHTQKTVILLDNCGWEERLGGLT